MTVKKTTKDGKTKITFENLENNLLYCYFNQATWRDHLIIPFSSSEIKEYLPEYKEVYNTYKKVFQKYDKTLPFTACAK